MRSASSSMAALDGAQSRIRGLGEHKSKAETTPTSVFVFPVPGGPCKSATPMHGRMVSAPLTTPGLIHRRIALAWLALNVPLLHHPSITRLTDDRFFGSLPRAMGSGIACCFVPGTSALPVTAVDPLFHPV